MKEACAQINQYQNGLNALSEEDVEVLKNYKPHQIVRIKIYGVKKPRSVRQMNLYWAACGFVAKNTDDKLWNTKNKVDFQCRVELHYIDSEGIVAVKPDGEVIFQYGRIAFEHLDHIVACNYFNRAYEEVLSQKLGMNVDKFINAVKESLGT